MPFTYETPVNPYTPTIAELLLRRGDIVAAGDRASGQAWGTAIRDVGQSVGGAITQLTDPRRQMEQIALNDAKQRQAGQAVVDRALTPTVPNGPQPEGTGSAPSQHPYLDENGLIDPTKVSQLLEANGMAHLAPDLLKGVEAQNSSIAAYKATQEQAATKHEIMLGSAANTALNLLKTGMSFPDAATHATSSFVATGVLKQDEVQQAIGALAQLPPDQQIAKLQQLKDRAEQLGPKETLKEGEIQKGMFGTTLATNPKTEKPPTKVYKPVEGTLNGKAVSASFDEQTGKYFLNGQDVSAAFEPKAEKKSFEAKSVLLDGKPAEVTFDPAKGKYFDAGGVDVSARVKPIPSVAQVNIDAGRLSNAALEQQTDAYLAGTPLPARISPAQRAAIMNRAAEKDPKAALALNQANFKAESANLTNLQKTEGTLSAFENTAGKNLDQFLTLADKIPDTGIPWLNTPVRMLDARIVGSANMAAINAARDVALREIARVTNDPKMSGALTDSARHEIQSLVPANATLPQIKAVVKVLKQDMANVHTGLTQQIESVKSGLSGHPGATGTSARDPMGIR